MSDKKTMAITGSLRDYFLLWQSAWHPWKGGSSSQQNSTETSAPSQEEGFFSATRFSSPGGFFCRFPRSRESDGERAQILPSSSASRSLHRPPPTRQPFSSDVEKTTMQTEEKVVVGQTGSKFAHQSFGTSAYGAATTIIAGETHFLF